MTNPYDLSRVPGTAARMLKRYSRSRVAWEIAHDHGNDFPEGSEQRTYWRAVAVEIQKQTKGGDPMTRKEAIRQTEQANTLMSLGFTAEESEALRRISKTLHTWFEHECNGTIQRDGDNGDGKPYWYNTHTGRKGAPVADREAGAMRRLRAIVDARNARALAAVNNPPVTFTADDPIHLRNNLRYYIQSDPRGASLYIIRPGDVPEGKDVGAYYSRGICVY